ncbi:MAG: hypothetical protein MK137_03765, partial [Rickettsiales bacterium]|nr:hypothetical protein [Rickettsiales bacterium]
MLLRSTGLSRLILSVCMLVVCSLTSFYEANALTREQIKTNVEKYGVVKAQTVFNLNEILLYNDTKQRNEDFSLYLEDQQMTLLYLWRNSCEDCIGKVKYIDALKGFQKTSNQEKLNVLPIANFYDNQRSLRRKFVKQDIEYTDLLFIKNIEVFKQLIGDGEQAYF